MLRPSPSFPALATVTVLHALFWAALVYAPRQPLAPAARPGRVLTVALQAPTVRPAAAVATPQLAELAVAPTEPLPVALPVEPARAALHYYLPHELDRELSTLIDHSDEAEIALERDVLMHLFVDADGKVSDVAFEGEPPAPEQAAALRATFMRMEFLPGLKDGKPVPARLTIVIAPAARQGEARPY